MLESQTLPIKGSVEALIDNGKLPSVTEHKVIQAIGHIMSSYYGYTGEEYKDIMGYFEGHKLGKYESSLFDLAKSAEKGDVVKCPLCFKTYTKKTKKAIFCKKIDKKSLSGTSTLSKSSLRSCSSKYRSLMLINAKLSQIINDTIGAVSLDTTTVSLITGSGVIPSNQLVWFVKRQLGLVIRLHAKRTSLELNLHRRKALLESVKSSLLSAPVVSLSGTVTLP